MMDIKTYWFRGLLRLSLAESLVTNGSLLSTWIILSVFSIMLFSAVYALQRRRRRGTHPLINTSPAEYYQDANGLVTRGFKDYGGRPFRINSGLAEWTILSAEHADEVRKHKDLVSTKTMKKLHPQAAHPGFEPYAILGSELMQDVIKCITRNLASLNRPLSDETASALRDILTNNSDWHEVELRPTLIQIIARVTSLVFVGPELCRDPAWLDITVTYFAKSNAALKELRRYPAWLRPLVSRIAPKNRELRNMVATARRLVDPVLRGRREWTRLANERGESEPKYHDALSWGEQLAVKRGVCHDAAVLQLALSLTAMHTSGDLIAQLLLDLCRYQDLIQPLREEMREILGPECWNRATTLNDLRLLDSVLKESQRLKPVSIISMGRVARENVVLDKEVFLPKNSIVATSCHFMWDPARFEKPLTFDGYRFLKRRACGDPDKEHTATLVTTSPDHMGFGHGTYACPGRFFGVNEVKIILCHLLLKYELSLADGTPTQPVRWGFEILANPVAKLMIRWRDEHFDLDNNVLKVVE